MIKKIYLNCLSVLLCIFQIQNSLLVDAIHLDVKNIQPIDKEKLQLLLSFKKIIEEKSNTTLDFFEPILYSKQDSLETIYDVLYNVVIVQGNIRSKEMQLNTQIVYPSKYLSTPYVKSYKFFDVKKIKNDTQISKKDEIKQGQQLSQIIDTPILTPSISNDSLQIQLLKNASCTSEAESNQNLVNIENHSAQSIQDSSSKEVKALNDIPSAQNLKINPEVQKDLKQLESKQPSIAQDQKSVLVQNENQNQIIIQTKQDAIDTKQVQIVQQGGSDQVKAAVPDAPKIENKCLIKDAEPAKPVNSQEVIHVTPQLIPSLVFDVAQQHQDPSSISKINP